MTETQITFADINVGDKIRSVSPCGTERVGVVDLSGVYVEDADGYVIALPSWTIYRIEPAFTPLPIPEEKQWIRATLRGGDVVEGAVESLRDFSDRPVPSFRGWFVEIGGITYYINTDSQAAKSSADIIAWEPIDPPAPLEDWESELLAQEGRFSDAWLEQQVDCFRSRRNEDWIQGYRRAVRDVNAELKSAPSDPPAPPEPDWLGYVGYFTAPGGEVWDAVRDKTDFVIYPRHTSGHVEEFAEWKELLTLGTFTAVKP